MYVLLRRDAYTRAQTIVCSLLHMHAEKHKYTHTNKHTTQTSLELPIRTLGVYIKHSQYMGFINFRTLDSRLTHIESTNSTQCMHTSQRVALIKEHIEHFNVKVPT
jgi:hypothetical protein